MNLLAPNLVNINKNNNLSDTFVTDNLKIYMTYTYNTIFLKIFNTLTFTNYEKSIYESDIIENKFKINELYTFIHKSLKKEDNHTFTCNITSNSMNIELSALFNLYFKLNYEIKLDKKENTQFSQNINEVITKENSSPAIDTLKKDYDNLLIKYNDLNTIIQTCEICIGHTNYEITITNNLFVPILCESLNITILVGSYRINPKQITIYFSKIKKLTKLKKIYTTKQIPISLYDDITNNIIENKQLDDYCISNKIEIFFI